MFTRNAMTKEQREAYIQGMKDRAADVIAADILDQMGMDKPLKTSPAGATNTLALHIELSSKMGERAAFDLTQRASNSVRLMVERASAK